MNKSVLVGVAGVACASFAAPVLGVIQYAVVDIGLSQPDQPPSINNQGMVAFKDEVPICYAAIVLSEGVLMQSRIVGATAETVLRGAPVKVAFLSTKDPQIKIPVFELVNSEHKAACGQKLLSR